MTRIVVAGEALVDLIPAPDGRYDALPGGGPFNTARTIARLGGSVAWLGRLSTDAFGRRLEASLAHDDVELDLVQRTDDPTTLAIAELDAAGVATYRFHTAGTASASLEPPTLPAGTAALHVGTLGLALEPVGSMLERLAVAVTPETLLMVDVNARLAATADPPAWRARIRRLAPRADVVKASVDDLDALGMTAADVLAAGARVVLVTDGARPVSLLGTGAVASIPVPTVEVADTVGAGDAFGGAFLWWWLRQGLARRDLSDPAALRRAVTAGTGIAAETCRRVGAEPPRLRHLPASSPWRRNGGSPPKSRC